MRESDIVETTVTVTIKPKRIIKDWHMMGSNKIATNVSIKQHKKVIWKVTASMMCFISSEVRGPSLLFFFPKSEHHMRAKHHHFYVSNIIVFEQFCFLNISSTSSQRNRGTMLTLAVQYSIFIGPRSDHSLPMSLTNSLTNSRLCWRLNELT